MALILLIVLGASVGWIASIIGRTEDVGTILRQLGIGVIASLAGGLFANSGTILGGLSVMALAAALAVGAAALTGYHIYLRRSEA